MLTESELLRLAVGKRGMAWRARLWSGRLATPEDQARLLAYADQLAAEADDLERQADSAGATAESAATSCTVSPVQG
jgi:hypothetical protein